eukprot:g2234.t1
MSLDHVAEKLLTQLQSLDPGWHLKCTPEPVAPLPLGLMALPQAPQLLALKNGHHAAQQAQAALTQAGAWQPVQQPWQHQEDSSG